MEKNKVANVYDLPAEELPDFKIDKSDIPSIKLKDIHFQMFRVFEDEYFNFTEDDMVKSFACFHGPNGCGKTTILDCIQLIFSRFDGYEKNRLKIWLGKSVRHTDGKLNGVYSVDDFLVTANLSCSLGDYEIQINKEGFIKDHPEEIKQIIYRLCYYARFDQELHQFQLLRDKWPIFKDLFESVTGFKVTEKKNLFDGSDDEVQAEMMMKYVLGFEVHKPDETISHRECSSGERKIIKSFSTLLNMEYIPAVILVDNIAMHVESGRHLNLIESMKRCFPDSQIFSTTHSYQISRNLGVKSQLYDLRLIKASKLVRSQEWRLYVLDEIKDCIGKLKAIKGYRKDEVGEEIRNGEKLLKDCLEKEDQVDVMVQSKDFMQRVCHLIMADMGNTYGVFDE